MCCGLYDRGWLVSGVRSDGILDEKKLSQFVEKINGA